MRKFNRFFFQAVVILALIPFVPAILAAVMAISPILLVVGMFFGLAALRPFRRMGSRLFGGLTNMVGGLFKATGSGLYEGAAWMFRGRSRSGRFMGFFERRITLRFGQKGMLVDGRAARLSQKSTYESIVIQGGVGRGKSSIFVMPNLLNLPSSRPSKQPSFVISDTSGEIYQNTAGYLKRQGYTIKVLNLMEPGRSEKYNPLANAGSPQAIAEMAKMLVSASGQRHGGKASDPFWEQAAEKLIRIMAQCLHNQPDPTLRNLANLRHLITSFDAHITPKGSLGKIDQFVLSACKNDPGTFASYQAFVNGNLKAIQSILMSADVALDPVATPEMAILTSSNSISFDELRQDRVALYIIVNQTQMPLYAFLLNLFYADLFRHLLRNHQNPGRPVWLFLDEFGHLEIPNFEIYATTARKYDVAFALFLQSAAQLESRYGAVNARTMLEAIGTEIYLPGMALDTARNLEARLGRTTKKSLMAASDIIRMKRRQALMLNSNRLPIMLRTRRYFERFDLNRRSKIAPPDFPIGNAGPPKLIKL